MVETPGGRRRALILIDVSYVIFANASAMLETTAVEASLSRGSRTAVHLGLPNFPAKIMACEDEPIATGMDGTGVIDLGWVVHDTPPGQRATYFRASMADGYIDMQPAGTDMYAS